MNIQVSPSRLHHTTPLSRRRRMQARSRPDILNEVLVGFLWMSLDIPGDASLLELEDFSAQIAARIKAGANEDTVHGDLVFFQRSQFCRPGNPAAMRVLAQRLVTVVRCS